MAEISSEQQIPDKLFFKIGEVAELTGTKPHVLRYWESEFKMLRPAKGDSGQRIYRRKDVELIFVIKRLLYEENFTIAGAKKQLQRQRSIRSGPHEAKAGKGNSAPSAQEPKPPSQLSLDYAWLRKELQEILDVLNSG